MRLDALMTHIFPPSLIKRLITVWNGRMEDHERVVRDTCHNHHSCYINTNYSSLFLTNTNATVILFAVEFKNYFKT